MEPPHKETQNLGKNGMERRTTRIRGWNLNTKNDRKELGPLQQGHGPQNVTNTLMEQETQMRRGRSSNSQVYGEEPSIWGREGNPNDKSERMELDTLEQVEGTRHLQNKGMTLKA